jgi:VIT1/CCC1 family predicted Fe2+/Mn2+ transporter/rubrerythrin
MPRDANLARYRANFQDETESAALYRTMAETEDKAEIAEIYRRLAKVEEAHASFWAKRIERQTGTAPASRLGWRARVLIWMTRRLGANALLPTVMSQEVENQASYDNQRDASRAGMPAQERSHARILAHLASRSRGSWNGSQYARLEGRHGAGGGNTLRAAVLGANDGLVSTLSLVMGVAGAAFSQEALLAAAIAGMLAGACSMAMGEWISVQSSRELYERQIATEAAELEQAPAEEKEELVLIYQAKGFTQGEARTIAERVMSDKSSALDTLTREELGINPDDLGGSAWAAAASSFIVFLIGALIPVTPLILLDGESAILTSLVASAAGLFLIGAAITVFTGRSALLAGGRQLAIGLAAAAVTYGAGRLFGVVAGA